jgi:hypothetical protein
MPCIDHATLRLWKEELEGAYTDEYANTDNALSFVISQIDDFLEEPE